MTAKKTRKPPVEEEEIEEEEDEEEEDEEEEDEEEEDEAREVWVCANCKTEFDEWKGKCPKCRGIQSIVSEEEFSEQLREEDARDEQDPHALNEASDEPRPIGEIPTTDANHIKTGIGEFDRVMGGGAVPQAVTLVGGDPGIGKSTLLLEVLASLSSRGIKCLYITAEEAASQVSARAHRLKKGINPYLLLYAQTNIEVVMEYAAQFRPQIMVIDSIQTVHKNEGSAGSITELRDSTSYIIQRSKALGISTFLVGHVTKDGDLAGPKVLEHLVDTVLAFEGEKSQTFRTLRSKKNRNGSVTEVGIFEMTEEGMKEVRNASAYFLQERNSSKPGSVVAATSESNRPMLVEVQGLVAGRKIPGGGRLFANGVETSRLSLIIAVLEKSIDDKTYPIPGVREESLNKSFEEKQDRRKLIFESRDVHINIAGGIKLSEPAIDLAMAIALTSSLYEVAMPSDIAVFGEVGLTSEIRSVPRITERLAEIKAMGFERALVPHAVATALTEKQRKGIEIISVKSIQEALEQTVYPAILTRKHPKSHLPQAPVSAPQLRRKSSSRTKKKR